MKALVLTVHYDRDAFVAVLDATPLVRNWMKILDTSILIATYRKVEDISAHLHATLPNHMFIVVEANTLSANGYLMPQAWSFINNPTDSGKHPPDWGAGLGTSLGLIPPGGLPKQ